VYEALAEADLDPDWVAGISIGAVNAALIAGNAPEDRVAKLRSFWEGITSGPWWRRDHRAAELLRGDVVRQAHSQLSAGLAFVSGDPAFFTP
jgi:NTE family protein